MAVYVIKPRLLGKVSISAMMAKSGRPILTDTINLLMTEMVRN